ncbi:MAG TPA: RNA polymerase sigma factor [Myxococcales bacterium]|nr:RNA polymerase sigma factor [Myxococcales bacterium]
MEAYELLWERHRDSTYRLLARVLGRYRSLVDEIFQDTWLEVATATHYVPGSFRGYIRTIATRAAMDRLRAASITMADQPREEDDRDESVAMTSGNPVANLEARESTRLILGIVDTMALLQRAAWTLRYVEQMTFEELAEAMDVKLGTAKSRVRLANEFIEHALRDQGIDPSDLENDT